MAAGSGRSHAGSSSDSGSIALGRPWLFGWAILGSGASGLLTRVLTDAVREGGTGRAVASATIAAFSMAALYLVLLAVAPRSARGATGRPA